MEQGVKEYLNPHDRFAERMKKSIERTSEKIYESGRSASDGDLQDQFETDAKHRLLKNNTSK